MFTRLRIQNFKAWRDTGDIRLAPLTVFFGPNSSGKTSLLQFLLMLQQTAQSSDRRQVLNLGGDGRSLVDLGVWPEVVYAHDARRSLCFEMAWHDLGGPQVNKPHRWGTTGTFSAQVGAPEGHGAPVVMSFRHGLGGWGGRQGEISLGMNRRAADDYDFWCQDELGELNSARKPEMEEQVLPPPIHFYGFPQETGAYFSGARFTDLAVLDFVNQLDSIRYLGPLRQMPKRLYAWTGAAIREVGIQGEQVMGAILAARKRELQPEGEQTPINFEALIAHWLMRLGLLESFEARPIAPHRNEYEVLVRVPGSRVPVNLVDVGFGISQVLPAMVQLFCVEEESVLIFEQPEIHLHPRAQSELADLFIEGIRMWEDGRPRHVQLLVESHSEHFLRRIQRRIAEGKLSPEETALYFCTPGPEGSVIERLQVDQYGRISNWPDNFFGDAIGDIESQMDAMLRRMEEEEPHASE
jgi:hypothetical protein